MCIVVIRDSIIFLRDTPRRSLKFTALNMYDLQHEIRKTRNNVLKNVQEQYSNC